MSATLSRPSYAALFRIPHTRRTFTAALIGRLSYGIISLAMMLTVTRATGSYAVAGTVMALFGAMSVFLSPARAALIDRYGPRRALLPMASLYAGLLTAFAAAAWRPGAPAAALGALAVAAGSCTPPLGPTMRAVWGEVVEDRLLLQRAYSLDGVAEEILFVSGPLLVGAVVQFAPPAAGVALSALLVWAGTLAFVLSPVVAGVRPAAEKKRARSGRRFRGGRALAQPVVVAAGVGLSLGSLDLLVMAFAQQRHHGDDVVAWVLAALSVGSALGGLLNGAVNWRRPARVRLPLQAGGLGLALLAAGLAPGLGTLTVAVACAGFFVAPALTTSYLIADEAAPPGFRTQAGAWVNTAVNAGSSGGAAGVGLLVGHVSLGLCFAASGAVAVAAGLISVRGAGTSPRPVEGAENCAISHEQPTAPEQPAV
ncbi:MFS transporter [Streptomyces albiflavescens]|uniref:MFS transporter n=1 Tax=Streptomyces albiflavescens TaxID=1623582 RepID=A0A917Y871_9ACTN|nr:MFS transporter [Streptomyces albiflavescens]GGN77174.1 MFS transporter [Streptomyces albiflavescens]